MGRFPLATAANDKVTAILIWLFIAGTHDLYVSIKGRECSARVIDDDVIEAYTESGTINWADAIKNYSKNINHPAKKYLLKNELDKNCSKYIKVSIYEYSEKLEVNVYTKNYIDGYPANISERLGYVGLTIGITMFFVGLLFGMMKWLTWLIRE